MGLKVDVDAVPRDLVAQLRQGRVDLDDPATTLALLRLDSVVGVTGFFNEDGSLRSLGIQCALCHSTVDDSSAPGIGHRLDGFANRDLNVGAIVNLSPDLRSPDNVYKTMNLAGLFIRERGLYMRPENKGRFYHDGRFVTLLDVVRSYDERFDLGLSPAEQNDLVEYLKSL